MIPLHADPARQARYLLSIACLVKDAAKHDEIQQKAKELLTQGRNTAPIGGREGNK